jgi:multidrug efflux pump
VQDRTGSGNVAKLTDATSKARRGCVQAPRTHGVSTTFDPNVPQYQLDLDRDKAKALNVPINSVFDAMQASFGSLYVNDFTLYGRNYQVNLQSEADFRQTPDDLRQVFVRADSAA